MKIVAQSVVPTSPLPYLHLGYFSALENRSVEEQTTNQLPNTQQGYGAALDDANNLLSSSFSWLIATSVFVIAGVIVAIMLRRQRVWCICAVAFSCAATLLLLASLVDHKNAAYYRSQVLKNIETDKRFTASIQAQNLIEEIRNQSANPSVSTGTVLDPWQRGFRVTDSSKGDLVTYTVTSAGPDGAFSTSDDVFFRQVCQQNTVITETLHR